MTDYHRRFTDLRQTCEFNLLHAIFRKISYTGTPSKGAVVHGNNFQIGNPYQGDRKNMLRALIVGIILGAALVLGGIWLYFSSGRAPVAVTDSPIPFEKKLAHAALNAHLDKQQRSEPAVPADETNLLAGAEVYKQNCAVCHGLPGVAPSAISEGEYPKPPELFKGTGVTDDAPWETYWKASNGIRLTGMPGFKGRLTEVQLWQVSQLLANADKISPTVKAALTISASGATRPSANTVIPTK
jgi:thiosulfate dehydrogenase